MSANRILKGLIVNIMEGLGVKGFDKKGNCIMIYKYCRCGKKIEHTKKLCDECTEKYGSLEKDRYRRYNASREDKEYQRFYTSKEWIEKRSEVVSRDKGLCLLCFYNNIIEGQGAVHHIDEIKDNWDLRLDEDNLICLCAKCHRNVHKEYKKNLKNKIKTQRMLKGLVEKSKLELDIENY